MVHFVLQMRELRLEEYATSPFSSGFTGLLCHPPLTQDNDLLPHALTPHASGKWRKGKWGSRSAPFQKSASAPLTPPGSHIMAFTAPSGGHCTHQGHPLLPQVKGAYDTFSGTAINPLRFTPKTSEMHVNPCEKKCSKGVSSPCPTVPPTLPPVGEEGKLGKGSVTLTAPQGPVLHWFPPSTWVRLGPRLLGW